MARITRVKKAQQRYATKPVLDENGEQVYRTRTLARPTKRTGKTETRERVTERDLTKPLPNLRCDFPGCSIDGGEILPGTPYKWIKPKSGPYGGHQRNRHAAHPDWNVWDYSNSLSAQVARIEHEATSADLDSLDDAEATLNTAAEAIRELAEQKRESAQNIEDGFGHPTSMSEDLESQADDLDSWADDVEGTTLQEPSEFPCGECSGSGEAECPECNGTGHQDDEDETDCDVCSGSGEVECEACDDNEEGADMEAAREAWVEAIQEALAECPV